MWNTFSRVEQGFKCRDRNVQQCTVEFGYTGIRVLFLCFFRKQIYFSDCFPCYVIGKATHNYCLKSSFESSVVKPKPNQS